MLTTSCATTMTLLNNLANLRSRWCKSGKSASDQWPRVLHHNWSNDTATACWPCNMACSRNFNFSDSRTGLWRVEEDGEEQQPFHDFCVLAHDLVVGTPVPSTELWTCWPITTSDSQKICFVCATMQSITIPELSTDGNHAVGTNLKGALILGSPAQWFMALESNSNSGSKVDCTDPEVGPHQFELSSSSVNHPPCKFFKKPNGCS